MTKKNKPKYNFFAGTGAESSLAVGLGDQNTRSLYEGNNQVSQYGFPSNNKIVTQSESPALGDSNYNYNYTPTTQDNSGMSASQPMLNVAADIAGKYAFKNKGESSGDSKSNFNYRGAAGQAVSAIGDVAYTSNYKNRFTDPQMDQGEYQAYDTTVSAAGYFGPVGQVVGGAIKLGDAIGDPIRKRLATTDEKTGEIKDRDGFIAGNTVGSMLNPGKSWIETWGSDASTGEKIGETLTMGVSAFGRREKEIEDKAKAEIAEKERLRRIKEKQDLAASNLPGLQERIFMKDGGNLFGNGGVLDFNMFNEGGTHEDNPNMGIPQGVSQDNGKQNLVEEGETRWQDYIFSDRTKLSKDDVDAIGLPNKMKDKTLSDASKFLMKESKERPNDPISKNGVKDMMNRLQAISEKGKIKKQINDIIDNDPGAAKDLSAMLSGGQEEQQMARGGNLFNYGRYGNLFAFGDYLNEDTGNEMLRYTPMLEGLFTDTSKPQIETVQRTAPTAVSDIRTKYQPQYISEGDVYAPIEKAVSTNKRAIANATAGNKAAYLSGLQNLAQTELEAKANAMQKARMYNTGQDQYATQIGMQKDMSNQMNQTRNASRVDQYNQLTESDQQRANDIRYTQSEEKRIERNAIMSRLLENLSNVGRENLLRKDAKEEAKLTRESGINTVNIKSVEDAAKKLGISQELASKLLNEIQIPKKK